ncbi:MAG: neutral zinc metallopeptidase [Nitrososphaera sp.]|jgi:predicted metalloprotease
MKWREGRRSSNIEDRRGMGLPLKVGGGIGGLVVLLIVFLLGGGNFNSTNLGGGPVDQAAVSGQDKELVDFVSVVLADTEDTWSQIFAEEGRQYRPPTLVLFSGAVDSACGYAESAVGPFYCPSDEKVYIDLSFYRDLKDRFGAPGDFAQAYVIAHEVGHHVQNQLGISAQVEDAQQGLRQAGANRLSVMQELQADCLAGVWANNADRARGILEQGDVEEALNAASSIGDDRLQMQSQGHVTPDSFTHGTSAQRTSWFNTGLQSGTIDSCDTFAAMGQ